MQMEKRKWEIKIDFKAFLSIPDFMKGNIDKNSLRGGISTLSLLAVLPPHSIEASVYFRCELQGAVQFVAFCRRVGGSEH